MKIMYTFTSNSDVSVKGRNSMDNEKTISIVVSVYNEEKALEAFFEEFDKVKCKIGWKGEVIFVNDGSNDKSIFLLKQYAQNRSFVKIIDFSKNFGHEAAMIAGIDNASGDAIICMDADLQHPLTCIPLIIEKLEDGYDIINMVRIENKTAGIIKNITSKFFYKLINVLSDQTQFEENASDFFAIDKVVANVLKNEYREKIRFLRGYVQDVGFNKTTIQYKANARVAGESHYSIKRLLKYSISTIVCFSEFPLKVGMYAGVISAILGGVVLIYSLLTRKGAPSGYTTIICFNCFMFAVLFLLIGIIGQYIAVLFSEIKNRPIYIVKEKINFQNSDNEMKHNNEES